ncbi:MAG: hypothetical protein J0H64_00755, partial [Actinobacteria bacterium]|nr:hypothetical protein [Actinomycetota bacterium]
MVRTLSKLAIGVLAAGALAITPALAASSAQAAVTPKCTVTLTAPKTISVSTEQQLFYIDVAKGANGQTPDCVKRFQINLVRSSDNLAMWGAYWRSIQWKWTSDTDYQNGRMKWQLPAYIDFALSGTYQLVI